MTKEVKKEFIVRCNCGDVNDHCIHIAQYDLTTEYGDDKLGQCVISTRLDPCKNWYKRVWTAMKYIFGVGHYQYIDTVVDVDILKEVVLQLEDERSDAEKESARPDHSHVKVV